MIVLVGTVVRLPACLPAYVLYKYNTYMVDMPVFCFIPLHPEKIDRY